MKKKVITSFIIRIAMSAWWIAALLLFLMTPSVRNYFFKPRSLTIFTWPLLLDPIYLKKFERDTGITLHITYFENGAALLNKLMATEGSDVDLIIPDDHSLQLLIQKGLLKKIDKERIPFFSNIRQTLQAVYADSSNDYSIPYYSGIYGIGYNTHKYSEVIPSWSLLFPSDLSTTSRICMTDDPREAVMIAAQYLFGTITALNDAAARKAVRDLLIAQKKSVDVYALARADSLLQIGSCDFAVIVSPEMVRLQREHPEFAFIIPKEGAFTLIDSFAIPRTSKKDSLIYRFLNYVYTPEVLAHHAQVFGFESPIAQQNETNISEKSPNFFRGVISDQELNELWIEVLAA